MTFSTTLKRLVAPMLGLALAGGVAWRSGNLPGRPPRASASPGATNAPPPSARVSAEGRVVAYPGSEVVVGTEVAGLIVDLPIWEKSVVKKGDLLAVLNSADLRAARAEALARVAEADADAHYYEAEVRREDRLLARSAGTPAALDANRRLLAASRARRDGASATARRFDALIAKTRIVSPIDGVVTARHVEPGQTVDAAERVATVADLSRLRVEAEVDEYDTPRVAPGAAVSIAAEGYGATRWAGRVEEIPDTVVNRRLRPDDPGRPIDARVLPVKVALDAPTPLKLGQRVEAEITAAR